LKYLIKMERRLRENESGRAIRAIDYLQERQALIFSSPLLDADTNHLNLSDVVEVKCFETTIPNGFIRSLLHGKSHEIVPFLTKKHDNGDYTLTSSRRAIKHVIFHADHPHAK